MLSKISSNCTLYLLEKKKIEEFHVDLYYYGFEIFFSSVFLLVSILIYASLFFQVIDGIIFLIIFVPIRFFCGGYHAETYSKCYVITNLLFLSTVFFSYTFHTCNEVISAIIYVVFSIYIFRNAPIIHPNNPLTQFDINKNKFYTRIFIFINIALTYIFYRFNPIYGTLATYTIILVAIMMYIQQTKGESKI